MDVITYLFHPQERGHYFRGGAREKRGVGSEVVVVGGGGWWAGNRAPGVTIRPKVMGWLMNPPPPQVGALCSARLLRLFIFPRTRVKDHFPARVPTTGFFPPAMTYLSALMQSMHN